MAVSVETIDDQERAIAEWAERWSAHDVDGLIRLFTDDAVYQDVPMGAVSRGANQLREFASSVLSRVPDITFEMRSTFVDGTAGTAEWIMRGTRGVSGATKRFEVRGVSVFEFTDSKIRRCSDYWDMAIYREQLLL